MRGRRSWLATAALFCSVASVIAADGVASLQQTAVPIAACRRGETGDTQDPNLAGGWSLEKAGGLQILCLTGTLEAVPPAEIAAALHGLDGELVVVVRSTGGPVETWLTIAEWLIDRVDVLVVDEACLSSCANYMMPVAKRVLVAEDGLVAWHGGPYRSEDAITRPRPPDIAAIVVYEEQAGRTERLFRRLGIDVSILALSAIGPDPRTLDAVASALGLPASPPPVVGGYAFSPARLAHCFGFRNVGEMWHAGDDLAVARLAQRRSRSLLVLESPFNRPGAGTDAPPRCGRR
jgi:hypothetical protein